MRIQFIIKIAAFIIVLVLLDQGIGWLLDKRYQENTCDYSNGYLNDYLRGPDYDTLYVGSSRILHSIDASELGKNTRNLARQRKHLYYNTCIIDLLSEKNKLPKKVLYLNIELEDLYGITHERLVDDVYSLKYYYGENDYVTNVIRQKGYAERLKLLSSIYRHNGDGWKLITYPLSNNCSKVPEDGYRALPPTDRDSLRLFSGIESNWKPQDYELNLQAFEFLNHVITICERNNIELHFVNTPYFEFPEKYRQAQKELDEFCQRKQIDFIDWNNHSIAGLENPEVWYDNMHLNSLGAEIFTHYLIDCKKLDALQ